MLSEELGPSNVISLTYAGNSTTPGDNGLTASIFLVTSYDCNAKKKCQFGSVSLLADIVSKLTNPLSVPTRRVRGLLPPEPCATLVTFASTEDRACVMLEDS